MMEREYDYMNYPLFDSFVFNPNINMIITSSLASIITFLPKLLAALIVFFVGKLLAKSFSSIIVRVFSAASFAKFINSFQLGVEMKVEVASGLVQAIGLIIRYAVMYVSVILALQIVGLSGVADFLSSLVTFLPKMLSALLILFIGVIIAGFVESLVKRALVTLDPATARLGGKISSYTVVSFFTLMSLAELGLAATFINTLFIGLVATVSLAFGLSIGLGSKDLVRQVLSNWYEQRLGNKKSKKQ